MTHNIQIETTTKAKCTKTFTKYSVPSSSVQPRWNKRWKFFIKYTLYLHHQYWIINEHMTYGNWHNCSVCFVKVVHKTPDDFMISISFVFFFFFSFLHVVIFYSLILAFHLCLKILLNKLWHGVNDVLRRVHYRSSVKCTVAWLLVGRLHELNIKNKFVMIRANNSNNI